MRICNKDQREVDGQVCCCQKRLYTEPVMACFRRQQTNGKISATRFRRFPVNGIIALLFARALAGASYTLPRNIYTRHKGTNRRQEKRESWLALYPRLCCMQLPLLGRCAWGLRVATPVIPHHKREPLHGTQAGTPAALNIPFLVLGLRSCYSPYLLQYGNEHGLVTLLQFRQMEPMCLATNNGLSSYMPFTLIRSDFIDICYTSFLVKENTFFFEAIDAKWKGIYLFNFV